MKTRSIWIAILFFVSVAFAVAILRPESNRISKLAKIKTHERLSEVLARTGVYDASEVFGNGIIQICAFPAYATERSVKESSLEITREAIATMPPSEDLSWRLLTLGQGTFVWFVQDEIRGASLALQTPCLELTSKTKIVVEPSEYGKSNSSRIVRFISPTSKE